MPYQYRDLRPEFFTPQGDERLEKARIKVATLLLQKAEFMAQDFMEGQLGDVWLTLACLDRQVELGELVELQTPPETWAQHRLFARPLWHKNPEMDGGENFFMRRLLFSGSQESMREMREMIATAQNRD